jgi:hypothetical protein
VNIYEKGASSQCDAGAASLGLFTFLRSQKLGVGYNVL